MESENKTAESLDENKNKKTKMLTSFVNNSLQIKFFGFFF